MQEDIELTPRLQLSGGLRLDHARYQGHESISGARFNRRYTLWSPQLSATYRAHENIAFYASYARGFRFPNLDEAFGFFGFTPPLNPQRSDSYEVGLKLQHAKVRGNFAAYSMNVWDEIFYNPKIGFFGENANIDRVRHRGIESSLSFTPWEWIEFYGTYTLDITRVVSNSTSTPSFEGRQMPNTPRHRGSIGIRSQLPLGFSFNLNGRLVGSRYVANDVSNIHRKLSGYTTWDTTLSYNAPLSRWNRALGDHVDLQFSFSVRNIFDHDFVEQAGVSTFGGFIGFFPSPGRQYQGMLRMTLRK